MAGSRIGRRTSPGKPSTAEVVGFLATTVVVAPLALLLCWVVFAVGFDIAEGPGWALAGLLVAVGVVGLIAYVEKRRLPRVLIVVAALGVPASMVAWTALFISQAIT